MFSTIKRRTLKWSVTGFELDDIVLLYSSNRLAKDLFLILLYQLVQYFRFHLYCYISHMIEYAQNNSSTDASLVCTIFYTQLSTEKGIPELITFKKE